MIKKRPPRHGKYKHKKNKKRKKHVEQPKIIQKPQILTQPKPMPQPADPNTINQPTYKNVGGKKVLVKPNFASMYKQPMTSQERLEYFNTHRLLVNKINQRLRRAEVEGFQGVTEYNGTLELIERSLGVKGKKRFSTTIDKNCSDSELLERINALTIADSLTSEFSGKKNRDRYRELKRRFSQVKHDITYDTISTIMQAQQRAVWSTLRNHLSSEQIVNIVEYIDDVSDEAMGEDVVSLVEKRAMDYLTAHRNEKIRRQYFNDYLVGQRDIHNQRIVKHFGD